MGEQQDFLCFRQGVHDPGADPQLVEEQWHVPMAGQQPGHGVQGYTDPACVLLHAEVRTINVCILVASPKCQAS